MNLAIWIGVAASIIASFGPITYGGLRRVNDRALRRHVAKVGLPLPPQLREPVVRRIAQRERLASRGGVAGLAIGVVIVVVTSGGVTTQDGGESSMHGLIVILATAVGASVGAVIAAAGPGAVLNPAAPRLAHGTETSLVDYLHRNELAALVGTIALSVIAGILAVVLTPDATTGQRALLFALTGLAALAGGAVFAVLWFVAGRPQRAGSTLELAWDDVMRADGMRQLLVTGLILSVVATGALGLATLLFGDGEVATLALLGLGVVQVGVAFGLPLPFWIGRLHAYPVRRLWPYGVGMGAAC